MQKNNLFDVSNFAENRKINLCAFVKAHILHLLILEIVSLKLIASIIVIFSTICARYLMISSLA